MKSAMRFFLLVLTVALCASDAALAQSSYPAKPMRLVAPFPPGGPADILARIIGQHLADRLGQQVIVDNRAGAGGNIGADIVAKAPPDGYTLLLGAVGSNAINASPHASLPYDNI